MTCDPLPTSPYRPKNSPSCSGGERRTISTRSATWTPPSPLPRIAPASRNSTSPGVPGTPSEMPPRTSPTAHDPRTIISVRFGPSRSTSAPQPKLARTATTVSDSRMRFATVVGQAHRLGRDDAMTTMIVLTASE